MTNNNAFLRKTRLTKDMAGFIIPYNVPIVLESGVVMFDENSEIVVWPDRVGAVTLMEVDDQVHAMVIGEVEIDRMSDGMYGVLHLQEQWAHLGPIITKSRSSFMPQIEQLTIDPSGHISYAELDHIHIWMEE